MIGLSTTATRYWRTSLLAAALAAAPFLGSAVGTQANAANSPALRLIKIIPINGTSTKPATKIFSFDISWVDPTPIPGHPMGLYYLADRSNAALDVVDVATDTLFGQIGGSAAGQANFVGDTGVSAASGPDGVVAAFPCIFAGDGNSRLLSFNGAVSFTTVVSALNTGGQLRVDEMAVDAADGLVLGANNAETAGRGPFSTIATYNKTTCALSNPIKTFFDVLPGGHKATNGIEQPVWDPGTQRFYVSLPEIDGGTGITGAVAKISTAGVVETIYPINYCSPAGLTLGPNGDLLVGCNTIFDTAGNKCTNLVPSPAPTGAPVGHPTTCTGVAFPQSAVCNPARGCTGNALVSVPGAGGGDEVWFNPGDGNYYVTGGNDPKGPLLAVIASGASATQKNTLTQVVPTLSPIPAVLTNPGLHSSGTVHSVAASAANNHVYVPLPANTAYNLNGVSCVQGCIAVFSAQ
jgi:hypothetical protein